MQTYPSIPPPSAAVHLVASTTSAQPPAPTAAITLDYHPVLVAWGGGTDGYVLGGYAQEKWFRVTDLGAAPLRREEFRSGVS
jgi:hypothetical protein